MTRAFTLLLLLLPVADLLAAAAPPSDPQAVALAAKSVAAMTGGGSVSDVVLTGTVTRIAGSDQEAGTATLMAKGFGESRVDFKLGGGARSEIRNNTGSPNEGNWMGQDGAVNTIALHNCFTDASWFFPALGSLAATATNPNVVLVYLGQEKSQQNLLQHLQAYTYDAKLPDAQRLSAMDFYLDPQTLLPVVVTFNEHPDNDQNVSIPVQVMFSDYRNVNGVQIPFHIQRFVNNSPTLDIQLTSANVNSGIADNKFSVQ